MAKQCDTPNKTYHTVRGRKRFGSLFDTARLLNVILETLLSIEMNLFGQTGVKPGGDDWLTPATVADPAFGCTYTNNAGEIPGNVERSLMPPCPAPL